MARSMATQAITLEWVKWRRGPRTSQIPSSGSRQPSRRKSMRDSWNAHVGLVPDSACDPASDS